MKRQWGPDVDISEDWSVPFSIAKGGAYMYWTHPILYPCDKSGFRIPPGHSSFEEKYLRAEGLKKIFCIGGSTTFGLFNSYEDSYPRQLERLHENVAVFNFGLCGMDATGSMHVLLDLLRSGYLPDLVIFLDGINEKQGWMQASEGRETYEEISWKYRCFHEVVYNDNVPMTLSWKKKELFSGLQDELAMPCAPEVKMARNDPLKFVGDQAGAYTKTKLTTQALANAWGFETLFFLEPTVWDVWGGEHDLHFDYIKLLYNNVMGRNEDVTDLSKATTLKPEHFIEWKHLDAQGNARLASAIAANL